MLSWIHLIVIIMLNQDDFLPRKATPLEDIFKSFFWYDYVLSSVFNCFFELMDSKDNTRVQNKIEIKMPFTISFCVANIYH
ncbi:hypothetical protein RchiOBHm_Chr4g0403531 [Rosa chinensis]|uniref:Uncharacterized protein n=1 Tax=Rosa chinensis TaxID=74649 RepID=A0A2P6QTM2_ROSCH|nr:hypothetical protein RchiOBHm_Chr4g0403531 [Rosa chinensis]